MDRVEGRPADAAMLMILVVLVGTGLAILMSASYHHATRLTGDALYFVRRQALFLAGGLVLAAVLTRTSLAALRRLIPLGVLAALALMALTFVPGIGRTIMGARRWIVVGGFSLEPSELVKVIVVAYLSSVLAKRSQQLTIAPLTSLAQPLLLVAVFAGLVYLQNDFSTAFFLIVVAVALLFVARVPFRIFAGFGVLAVPLAGVLLLSKEHRVRRLEAFLDPQLDPAGSGYQVLAARSALADGGAWGAGLGQGVHKLGGVPEVHSDFIFTVIGEEGGYMAVVLVVALFAALAWRGYRLSWNLKDRFSAYLAFGLTTCIVVQSLLNMAVVGGLVPATGLTLPFFSSGGSSLITTLVMAGILLNLSRQETADV